MIGVVGVNSYWYIYEFAKSRVMIHWHGLCWLKDQEPHKLLYKGVQNKIFHQQMADELAHWANNVLGMSAQHPAGCDSDGQPSKHLWAPPEGNADPPLEQEKSFIKDVL